MQAAVSLTALERRLLSDLQRGFPVVSRPFAEVARLAGADERTVLEGLQRMQSENVISRVGPVFRPHCVGASTLAAMAVPAERLEAVAGLVSAYPEVNHNYEREHDINLWFVVTARYRARVREVLADIEQRTGLEVLNLPMLADYHIDLGFPLPWEEGPATARKRGAAVPRSTDLTRSADARRLIAATQGGLALVARPYESVAREAGLSEAAAMGYLRMWLETGVVRRMGIVVRHHELGYRANAMAVWDVPDGDVDALGQRLAHERQVTLCYRRPRRRPRWPYNLFCMVHGADRAAVRAEVEALAVRHGLGHAPRAVLFSRRRFKQRGAWYESTPEARPRSSSAVEAV
ncbi:MAG: Lrp/AsnC family transcriptional regulator [Gammaproteobacteria bacterium]|nr:Lrp/AsnC family transcriptional regulator [Gammaproteobacteria bacterium]